MKHERFDIFLSSLVCGLCKTSFILTTRLRWYQTRPPPGFPIRLRLKISSCTLIGVVRDAAVKGGEDNFLPKQCEVPAAAAARYAGRRSPSTWKFSRSFRIAPPPKARRAAHTAPLSRERAPAPSRTSHRARPHRPVTPTLRRHRDRAPSVQPASTAARRALLRRSPSRFLLPAVYDHHRFTPNHHRPSLLPVDTSPFTHRRRSRDASRLTALTTTTDGPPGAPAADGST